MMAKGHYGAESHGVAAATPYHLRGIVRRGDACGLAKAGVTGRAEWERVANPRLPNYARSADLEVGDTAGWEACAPRRRPPLPGFARLGPPFYGGAGQRGSREAAPPIFTLS